MLLHLFQILGGVLPKLHLKTCIKNPVLQLLSLGATGEGSSDISTINIYLVLPS